MNEMLYGNSGKSDEGINIDMEQNLYQKLQRMFVPKLKSILSVQHQEGDRNFVYLGEVAEKSGSFTIYGYNAKLASDLRGGDYGHYIAVPLNDKAAVIDFSVANFLTEDGFVEYVNNKTLNEEKRFKIAPAAIDINVEAKKKIVNNIMESFMKVRKRKCVAFAFEDCTLEEFNAKSLGILLELIKYIPYRMRKNISFVSHVATTQRLPDTINLAAYPSGDIMPRDCVDIENVAERFTDGVFADYVEKVFAMSDSEREAYFENLFNDIEMPALNAGVEVKSDMYLLDVSTRRLWTEGSSSEAVKTIFDSLDSVLKIYPEYAKLAGARLSAETAERMAYIRNVVGLTSNPEELKSVYENVCGVYGVCAFEVDGDVIDIFKQKANTFIGAANDCSSLVSIAGAVVAIDVKVLDSVALCAAVKDHMGRNLTFEGIFEVYSAVKEKQYIDSNELDICLTEAAEGCILNMTGSYTEAKDKLSSIEHAFENFKFAYSGRDFSVLKEVYDSFHAKFSGSTSAEAVSKGNSIVIAIEDGMRGHCTFYEIKNYIKNLSDVEVGFDPSLKIKTASVYRRLTQTLYRQVADAELSYNDIIKLVSELLPAAKRLDEHGVYDGELRSGWGEEQYVADGLLSFVTVFDKFIINVNESVDLTDLIYSHDISKGNIKRDELAVKSLFTKYAPVIMNHWMSKNRKLVSLGNLKKAIKNVKKETGNPPYDTSVAIIENFISVKNKKKSGKGALVKLAIAFVLILALIAGGIFAAYRVFFAESENDIADAKYTISEEEVSCVREYLDAFYAENLSDAEFVIGTIKTKGKGNDTKHILSVENNLDSSVFDGKLTVIYGPQKEISKNFTDMENLEEKKLYAFVIQKSEDESKDEIYVRDVFEIPEELSEYDFSIPVKNKELSEEENKFCTAVLKYIGHLDKLVKPEEKVKPETGKNGGETEGGESGEGNDEGTGEENGEGKGDNKEANGVKSNPSVNKGNDTMNKQGKTDEGNSQGSSESIGAQDSQSQSEQTTQAADSNEGNAE